MMTSQVKSLEVSTTEYLVRISVIIWSLEFLVEGSLVSYSCFFGNATQQPSSSVPRPDYRNVIMAVAAAMAYIWHMAYGFMMTTVATDRTLNQDMRRPKEVSPPAPLHVSASNRMEPWHTKPKWSSEHVLWKLDSPNLKCWKKIWILLCCYAMPMSLCLCLALSMTLCHYATALRLPAMKC